MKRSPNPESLTALANRLGFTLSGAEARIYSETIGALEATMLTFADLNEDRPPVRSTIREPGFRPRPEKNPFNSFITRCFVQGAPQGPLAGQRVGLKDNVSVAGVPMTMGSPFFTGYIPTIDATVVTRLLDAGAHIIGKVNMDEFGRAGMGFGAGLNHFGRCPNPHDPDRLCGGSSSGSAVAVACGAVDLSIGVDQGGSIRVPAAWCGVVGHKPTHGLVPYTGVVSLEPFIDHVGPIGRTVEDVALMLECIAGPDGYDARQMSVPHPESYMQGLDHGVKGLRIGLLREGFGDPEAELDVDAAVRGAIEILRRAGAEVREVSVPAHWEATRTFPALLCIGMALTLKTFGGAMVPGYYDTHYTEVVGRFSRSEAQLLAPVAKVSLLLEAHLGYDAIKYYGQVQNMIRLYRRAYDEALQHVDCLVMPTVPIKAPRYIPAQNDEEAIERVVRRKIMRVIVCNTAQFNMTGHPALNVPCAMSEDLPVGMQLVGRHFADGTLLRAAYTLQQSIGGKELFDIRGTLPTSSG